MTDTLQQSNSPLRLAYAIIANPNPILASTSETNPSLVSLQVIISDVSHGVTLKQIDIVIPIGATATDLSTDALPQPTDVTPANVSATLNTTINTIGNTITIVANNEDPTNTDIILQGTSIQFYLNNIEVNDLVGVVYVAITETTAAASVTDNSAARLVKQDTDIPITNFWASNNVIYAYDQTVTLFWTCDVQGNSDYYMLSSSDGWIDPTQYDDTDGSTTGVTSPTLSQTTVFYLQAFHASGEKVGTAVDLTVHVLPPALYNEQCLYNTAGLPPRVVLLKWSSTYVSYCAIEINGSIFVSNAPASAPEGYPLFITSNGEINIRLIAYGLTDTANPTPAKTDYLFNSFSVTPYQQHALSYATPYIGEMTYLGPIANQANTYGIGITPDGRYAYIMGYKQTSQQISPYDPSLKINEFAAYMNKIDLNNNCSCKALSLTGANYILRMTNSATNSQFTYTVVSFSQSNDAIYGCLKRINVSNDKVDSFDNFPCVVGPALTPDNQFLLAVQSAGGNLTTPPGSVAITINASNAATTNLNLGQKYGYQTAVTPNGQIGFVTNKASNTVSMLDISQIASGVITVIATLNVGAAPTTTTVTPDGTLALVTNSGSNNISVINITTQSVEPNSINGLSGPFGLAITNDSKYAYVANYSNGSISVIDIARRSVVYNPITMGGHPVAVAITPDQQKVLVIQENSNVLTVITN